MGQIRFLAPERRNVPSQACERAYLAGMEGIPWNSRNRWEDDELVMERDITESGNLYIPWQITGHGEVTLCTASLMERPQRYHLPVELARGTLNRLRNQMAEWQTAGLRIPEELSEGVRVAMGHFIRAATSQSDPPLAAEHAERALQVALEVIDELCREYASQALVFRRQQVPQFSKLLGVNVEGPIPAGDAKSSLLKAFNSAAVPFHWKELEPNPGEYAWEVLDEQVQWCVDQGLRVCGGPLVRLQRDCLPDWIYLWEDDFDQLLSYALDFVEAAVRRYHDRVAVWQPFSRLNVKGVLALEEEQRLRLGLGTVELIRRVDPQTPVVANFDQPWAEYLATETFDLSPLHFADTVLRTELGVAGLGLEINLGYWPEGTLPRDLLEISRQIDRWSILGVPLLVLLTLPSGSEADPLARLRSQPLTITSPTGNGEVAERRPTPLSQRKLAEQLLPLLLAKPSVHGVVYNQLTDEFPHDFAHGGLFDRAGHPKPIVDFLIEFHRQQFPG